jgi:glycogen debranching enzyme
MAVREQPAPAAALPTDAPALLAGLVTVAAWSSAFVGIRSAGHSLSPGSIALGRLLVCSVLLGVVAIWRREPLPARRDLLTIAAFGVLWLGVYSVSLNAAERRVDAGTAAMLVNLGPILIALLAGLVLHEGFPRALFAGMAVAFGGCALIGAGSAGSGSRAGLGIALCLVAACAYAVAVVVQKTVLARVSPFEAWLGCTAATIACLAFAPTPGGRCGGREHERAALDGLPRRGTDGARVRDVGVRARPDERRPDGVADLSRPAGRDPARLAAPRRTAGVAGDRRRRRLPRRRRDRPAPLAPVAETEVVAHPEDAGEPPHGGLCSGDLNRKLERPAQLHVPVVHRNGDGAGRDLRLRLERARDRALQLLVASAIALGRYDRQLVSDEWDPGGTERSLCRRPLLTERLDDPAQDDDAVVDPHSYPGCVEPGIPIELRVHQADECGLRARHRATVSSAPSRPHRGPFGSRAQRSGKPAGQPNAVGATADSRGAALAHTGAMSADTVSVLEGNTFVVSGRNGDVDGSPAEPHGLFHRDTRFISRLLLTVGGQTLQPLSTDDLQYFDAQFFLVPGTGSAYTDATLSVQRRRLVGDGGFDEELTVMNHAQDPVQVEIRIEVDADFADLFEVKDAKLAKKGEVYRRIETDKLVLGYRRESYVRETWIRPHGAGAEIDESGVTFRPEIAVHGSWRGRIEVVAAVDGTAAGHAHAKYQPGDDARPAGGPPGRQPTLQELLAFAPRLETNWHPLRLTYLRSIVDVAALRFYPFEGSDEAVPAAGLPWFQTLFGRDSVITSFQALPFVPQLAAATLRVLGGLQGTKVDDFRDEEPGKIPHELRFGELTVFKERPHSPYYGSADATPLFLILLDEYERWTADSDLVRELEPAARAALGWIDDFGDRDGDGYVEYERRNTETGLENQCWKDSWNSIMWPDGTLATLPRATCEIQGYVYDAKRRIARLAREVWGDVPLSVELDAQADKLKSQFNHDFWLDGQGYYALALDGEKRPVDTLTSNIGQLLWSGIAEPEMAARCVEHLLGERLNSGWGVRTMAEGEGGYNPIGYHLGTVWPHDNSLIAAGLRRYGYDEGAARLAKSILEAAEYFLGRLPETFAGYARSQTHFPVEYPTACSPQAWSTGTPLLLLRVLLGLEPGGDGVKVDPVLPAGVKQLALYGVNCPSGRADAVADEAPVAAVPDHG